MKALKAYTIYLMMNLIVWVNIIGLSKAEQISYMASAILIGGTYFYASIKEK